MCNLKNKIKTYQKNVFKDFFITLKKLLQSCHFYIKKMYSSLKIVYIKSG